MFLHHMPKPLLEGPCSQTRQDAARLDCGPRVRLLICTGKLVLKSHPPHQIERSISYLLIMCPSCVLIPRRRKPRRLVLSMGAEYLRGGCRLPNQPKDTPEYPDGEADHETSHGSNYAD